MLSETVCPAYGTYPSGCFFIPPGGGGAQSEPSRQADRHPAEIPPGDMQLRREKTWGAQDGGRGRGKRGFLCVFGMFGTPRVVGISGLLNYSPPMFSFAVAHFSFFFWLSNVTTRKRDR